MADGPPTALRSLQPYLMVSKQFAKRDPIVSYYGRRAGNCMCQYAPYMYMYIHDSLCLHFQL